MKKTHNLVAKNDSCQITLLPLPEFHRQAVLQDGTLFPNVPGRSHARASNGDEGMLSRCARGWSSALGGDETLAQTSTGALGVLGAAGIGQSSQT